MSDSKNIILIHGFGQGASFLPFRKIRKGEQIFPVFKKEIQEKNAVVFDWAFEWEMNFNSFLSSKSFQKLYFKEREIAANKDTLKRLDEIMREHNPETILAHSMGCFLLLNYFQTYKPSENLKKICLIQADIDNQDKIPENLQKNLEKTSLEIVNLYCCWDQALFYSSFLHRKPRAGFVGWKQLKVQNKFIPLLDLPNPHECILRNKKLRKIIDF